MEVVKWVPMAKKLVEYLDKHGWKRLSGVIIVVFLAGWIGVLTTGLDLVWNNGAVQAPPAWILQYLTGIFVMIVVMYIVRTTTKTVIRVFAIWLLKDDAAKLMELKPEGRTEPQETPP